MKSSQFPVTYFANSFSSKKMFLNRNDLKVWQMIIVTIFLVFLMLNPVAINASKTPNLKLGDIMPSLSKEILKTDVGIFQEIKIENNQLVETKTKKVSDAIFINGSKEDFEKIKSGLNFETNQLVIKDENGLIFQLRYTESWDFSKLTSINDVNTWLTKEWNIQNTSYRILSTFFLVGLLVLSSTLFLIFGTSFFLWLTRKNHLSTIKTFKESVNITLNALFLSTLIAVVVGLVYYDVSMMLMIQAFGLAIEVLIIFAKTKFNDTLAVGGSLH
ncbi:hypothetical protein [Vagococcus sp.]|uniref:hypothetical protein n=1 Tax=Vagococcus sp. TaxID=1933889 RepID=UPI002FCBADF7